MVTFPDIDGYHFKECLGQGGFGSVFLAESSRWDEPKVAVKVLRSRDSIRADELERFAREGRIGRSLHHPHILPVYDVGTWQDTAYIVMKYVAGGAWGKPVAPNSDTDRTLTYEVEPNPSTRTERLHEVLEISEQIADALQFAHSHGIVHRDVKSSNVLVDANGHAYLADFGLAKQYVDPTTALTVTGALLGSPPYMPPEAISGRTHLVDQRSDIYSLGVTTYERCAGRLPFTGDSLEALRRQICDREPPRLSDSVAEAPAGLDEVLHKALEKDRRHRYQSASEFREDLVRIRRSERPLVGRASAIVRREARRVRRHRAPLAVGILVLASVLASYATVRWNRASSQLTELEVTSRWDQAELDLAKGQFTSAVRLFDEAIALAPDSPEPYLRKAAAYSMFGYVLKPEELVGEAIARGFDPSLRRGANAREDLHLALYLCSQDEYESAAAALERCIQRDPEAYAACVPLYRIYFRLREFDRAAELMRRYLEDLKPRNPRAKVMRAQLLELEKKEAEAWELLRSLDDRSYAERLDLRLDSHLGRVALRLDRLTEAQRFLEAAVEVDPNDGPSWVNLGVLAVKRHDLGRGELDEVYACARKAITSDPLLESAYQLLTYGNVHFDEAERGLEKAGSETWREPRLARLRAWRLTYEANEQYDHAQRLLARGNQSAGEGLEARALEAFRRAVELNDREVIALYALGQHEWVSNGNLPGARNYYHRASEARRSAEAAFATSWAKDTVVWSVTTLLPDNVFGVEVGLFATASQTGKNDVAAKAKGEIDRLLETDHDFDPMTILNLSEALSATAPERWRDCDRAIDLLLRYRVDAVDHPAVQGLVRAVRQHCR